MVYSYESFQHFCDCIMEEVLTMCILHKLINSMEVFSVFVLFYLGVFSIRNLVSIHLNCFGDSATLFSCETPAEICGLKKLNPTFSQHEGEQIMTDFSFLGELSI